MPLCTCTAKGCRSQSDIDPDTGQSVRGRYLDERVRKSHARLDTHGNAAIIKSQSSVETAVFQAICNAGSEDDPVVHSRTHVADPPVPSQARPSLLSTSNPSSTVVRLSQLKKYRSDFSHLLSVFQPPACLEFELADTTSSAPAIKYTNRTKGFLRHQQRVLQLLELVDAVESNGEETVRHTRRFLAADIQSHLEALDQIVVQLWEAKNYHDGLKRSPTQVITFPNGEFDLTPGSRDKPNRPYSIRIQPFECI